MKTLANRPMTAEDLRKLRDCQCGIPCIVFCNVVIRQMLEEEEYCPKHYLDKLEFGQCWRCQKEEEE
jgi:hypothetical protein